MMKKISLVLALGMLACLVGCGNQEPVISSSEYTPVTIEQAVAESDCAIVGTYEKCLSNPNRGYVSHVDYRFTVDRVLYGEVKEKKLDLYTNRDDMNMEDRYAEGAQYILILDWREANIRRGEIYMSQALETMMPVDGPYILCNYEVTPPEGITMEHHLQDLRASGPVISEEKAASPVFYHSDAEEIATKAQFIGYVEIRAMEMEGFQGTDTFTCVVTELLQGNGLNTRADGTIALAITKGEVQAGKTYLIGFNPADEGSVVYSQATLESVVPVDNQFFVKAITDYLETE